jgi:hypothetical protein
MNNEMIAVTQDIWPGNVSMNLESVRLKSESSFTRQLEVRNSNPITLSPGSVAGLPL